MANRVNLVTPLMGSYCTNVKEETTVTYTSTMLPNKGIGPQRIHYVVYALCIGHRHFGADRAGQSCFGTILA